MRKLVGLTIVAAIGISSFASTEIKPVVTGNTTFALNLFKELRSQPGNVFFSPFSISTALAMTAAGAKGETLAEMDKVLHLPHGPAAQQGFAGLIQSLQAKPGAGFELSTANALWGQQGFPFRQEFTDLIAKNFGGGLRQVDFGKPELASATINRWVEDQTKKRIKDLVNPNMFNRDSRLVLTNAIYFKGFWKEQFKKEVTQPQPFFTTPTNKIDVPMMLQGGKYRYYDGDGVQLVELPYKGDRLSMVFVLPKEKHQLAAAVEAKLTPDFLSKWLAAARTRPGDIAIPRFEFDTKYDLVDTLSAMGMRRPFSDAADFSGMTSAEALKIGFVVHKAFIKVDEEGSEAAAATGVGMVRAAAPIPEQRFEFRADQPFIFGIRDAQTGSLLFLGRVANPKN